MAPFAFEILIQLCFLWGGAYLSPTFGMVYGLFSNFYVRSHSTSCVPIPRSSIPLSRLPQHLDCLNNYCFISKCWYISEPLILLWYEISYWVDLGYLFYINFHCLITIVSNSHVCIQIYHHCLNFNLSCFWSIFFFFLTFLLVWILSEHSLLSILKTSNFHTLMLH